MITFLLMLVLLGYSCQEDPPFGNMQNNIGKATTRALTYDTLTIDNAKAFFETRYHSIALPNFSEGRYMSDSLNNMRSKDGHMHEESSEKSKKAVFFYPDLDKTNLIPEWKNAKRWSNALASYVEVPLKGGKIFALKKRQVAGKKSQTEKSHARLMLVVEHKHGISDFECYLITFAGTKAYMKEKGRNIKNLRSKPEDGKYTGAVYRSRLDGHIQQGCYYTNGKLTGKIFRKAALKYKIAENELVYYNVSLVDMSVNAARYSTGWEDDDVIFCALCNSSDCNNDCGDVNITYCRECGQPADNCYCCYSCGSYPCMCLDECLYCGYDPCRCCSDCGSYPCTCSDECYSCGYDPCRCCNNCQYYPCICNNECSSCGYDPCRCCSDCRSYPCLCCPICHHYPCSCKEEVDCPGPKCSTCNGTMSNTRSVSCPICNCANELCDEIDLFLKNPKLYSMLAITRSTFPPTNRPGKDYIYRGNKWVHINSLTGYEGAAYRATVSGKFYNHNEFTNFLIAQRDAFDLPISPGFPTVVASIISNQLWSKLSAYMAQPYAIALGCISTLFDATVNRVTDLYEKVYDDYNLSGSKEGGYVVSTMQTDGSGDFPVTHNVIEIYDHAGLHITTFVY